MPTTDPSPGPDVDRFLAGGSRMAARVRSFDWAATALGVYAGWPQSLKTVAALLLQSPVPMVLLWGPDGHMIYNDAYAVFAGGRHPELLGAKVREGWPEVADFNANVMKVVLAGGTLAYRDQELGLNRSGALEPAWMNLDYSPVPGDDGAPAGVICIVSETTARVLAERRAQEEREQMAQLFEQAPTFMALLRGPEYRFELANPGYVELAGNRPLLGLTFAEALPDAVEQGFLKLLDRVFTTGEPFIAEGAVYWEQAVAGRPARERIVDFVYQPIKDAKGAVTAIFCEGADVTQRVKADAALRQLNAELERQVIERTQARGLTWQVTPDLMGALDSDGYFKTSNPAWQAILGWSEAEVAATSIFELLHPDDVERTRAGFALTQVGQPAIRFPNRYRAKDGSYRWISWVGVFEDGVVYCTGRDITEEKLAEAELAKAQDALRQAQKMEAIGQLTGGIAHDFNNLLAGIAGSLDLLGTRLAQGRIAGVERYIDAAQTSTKRAAALTQRLLAFSRRQTLDPRPVDVNKLIFGMEELIRRSVGPAIEVEVVGAGGLWAARIDAPQLENALLNLAINARDAMPNGGRITIETANKWLDDRAAKTRNLPPGQYLSICVTDTGSGMTPEVIERVFDPFFTTKPLGQGTGLGLSMIHGFVRQSGGEVRVYSEVGSGTTMCLYLPRFQGSLEADEAPTGVAAADLGDGETVLVIDDEEIVRMLMLEVLQDAGYRALEADDGPSGLKLLQSGARVDLLITDVGLPGGMNGRQVADAARATRPDLRVLFVTGYAENAAVGNGHLDRGMQVITKPFVMNDLAAKVREILDG